MRLEGIEGRLLRLAEFQKMTCRSLAQADEAVRRIADVETSTNVDKLRLQKMLISLGGLQHGLKPKENVPPENSSPLTLQARSALQEYLQEPAVPDYVAAEKRRLQEAEAGVTQLDKDARWPVRTNLSSLSLPRANDFTSSLALAHTALVLACSEVAIGPS